jgi:hypothetical protein
MITAPRIESDFGTGLRGDSNQVFLIRLLNLIYRQLLNFVHRAAAIEEQKNRCYRDGDDLLGSPNDRHETPVCTIE